MPKPKITYRAVYEGKEQIFDSVKGYTHAVVVIYKEGDKPLLACCGSAALADKTLAKWSGTKTFIAAYKAYIITLEKV